MVKLWGLQIKLLTKFEQFFFIKDLIYLKLNIIIEN